MAFYRTEDVGFINFCQKRRIEKLALDNGPPDHLAYMIEVESGIAGIRRIWRKVSDNDESKLVAKGIIRLDAMFSVRERDRGRCSCSTVRRLDSHNHAEEEIEFGNRRPSKIGCECVARR